MMHIFYCVRMLDVWHFVCLSSCLVSSSRRWLTYDVSTSVLRLYKTLTKADNTFITLLRTDKKVDLLIA